MAHQRLLQHDLRLVRREVRREVCPSGHREVVASGMEVAGEGLEQSGRLLPGPHSWQTPRTVLTG